jgi:hypothetical protein
MSGSRWQQVMPLLCWGDHTQKGDSVRIGEKEGEESTGWNVRGRTIPCSGGYWWGRIKCPQDMSVRRQARSPYGIRPLRKDFLFVLSISTDTYSHLYLGEVS